MSLSSPLVLSSVIVPKPWGGRRLHAHGRHDDPDAAIGEAWDVADLPADATPVEDPVSRVVGGPHDGRGLADLLAADAAGLLGRCAPSADGRFPLLVKVLDAAETLSVQVHPPRSLDPSRFKTESWVVLDAEPDARLYLGVRDGVTLEDLRDAIGTAGLVDLLREVPARPGDVVHVPAGTIHALGAGVMVAEVQTPSDTTHRLWDWPDQRDGGRELHVDAGFDSIAAGWAHNLDLQVHTGGAEGEVVATDAYTLAVATLDDGDVLAASTEPGAARVCIVLEGGLRWSDVATADGGVRRRERTECVLLPAACTVPLTATGAGTRVLVATPA